ncbi:MAG: coproporphyrinogen dehydrogenase HemZ, partial [Oscillospiraceae bacterium]|nr:coproporphyrinogen dehydrogenase HemZ [Oscillospiraceae bacterium]
LCSVIAMGGGGSTKLVPPEGGRIERVFNAKYPREYIDGVREYIRRKGRIADFFNTKGEKQK